MPTNTPITVREERRIVQIMDYPKTGQLMALCNDGTLWLYDSVFNVWEPALFDQNRTIAHMPQPGEDPWLS